MTSKAARFAAMLGFLHAAHHVGDYWLQSDHQARHKGERNRRGKRACAAHVASYGAATTTAVEIANALLDLQVSPTNRILAQAFNLGSHYFFDRRWTAAKVYEWLDKYNGKSGFINNGGAAYLDQAFHITCLTITAAILSREGKK